MHNEIIQSLYDYGVWANNRLLASAERRAFMANLTDEQLRSPIPGKRRTEDPDIPLWQAMLAMRQSRHAAPQPDCRDAERTGAFAR